MNLGITKRITRAGRANTWGPFPGVTYTNYAVAFNGTDQLGKSNNFNHISDDSHSISFWIKRDGAPDSYSIIMHFQDRSFACGLDDTTGVISATWRCQDDGSRNRPFGTTNVCDNDWHHIVFVVDRDVPTDGVRLFIDGSVELVEDCDLTGDLTDLTGEERLLIAHAEWSDTYAEVSFDEIAIWNDYVLSPSDISTLYNSGTPLDDVTTTTDIDSSLVRYFKFDENTGNDAFDESDENAAMSLVNASLATWVAGA